MRICEIVPSADQLLALPVPEVAHALLRCFASGERAYCFDKGQIILNNLAGAVTYHAQPEYPGADQETIARVVLEAAGWLETSNLIAMHTYRGNDARMVTRLGERVLDERQFREFLTVRELPVDVLHPRIVERILGPWTTGDYDVAVSTAFKEAEHAVRTAAGLPNSLTGKELMRAAFDKGPLADQAAEPAEREGMGHLSAGAFMALRNPSSHRVIDYDDPADAIEGVVIASMIMRAAEKAGGSADDQE